jgi:hypothetical protein
MSEEFVRIKRGVRPFGGRIVKVAGRNIYPNGRRVVLVYAPTDRRAGWMHTDIREYEEGEVEKCLRSSGKQ